MICMPTGRPSDRARPGRDGRVADDVGRDGQGAVVLGADRHVADPRVEGDLGREGDVGVGGADRRSRPGRTRRPCASLASVRCASALRGDVEVEHLLGQVEPEGDLQRHVVLAGRPEVAERRAAAGTGWPSPTRSRGPGSARGRRRSAARRPWPAPRPPPAPRPRPRGGRPRCRGRARSRRAARQVVGSRGRAPSRRCAAGCRGRGVVARADVVPAGDVADRAGQAADHDGERRDLGAGPRGMRPAVPFIPTRPLKPAGMRIEPPPSPPVAMGTARRPPPRPIRPTSRRRCARAARGCGSRRGAW